MSMSMSRSEWPRVVISLIESEVVDLLYKFTSYQSSYFFLEIVRHTYHKLPGGFAAQCT